jgi:hypothetical protein
MPVTSRFLVTCGDRREDRCKGAMVRLLSKGVVPTGRQVLTICLLTEIGFGNTGENQPLICQWTNSKNARDCHLDSCSSLRFAMR